MLTWKDLQKNETNVVAVENKIKSSTVIWNAKKIFSMYQNHEIDFENAVQRGSVWDDAKSSLLIDSVLKEVPIDKIKAIEEENYISILDGKQRLLVTMIRFMSNEFTLKGIDRPIILKLGEGIYEEVDLNGATFNDLPQKLKDIIEGSNFEITVIDRDTPEEEVSDLFFRWNNGKPLSPIELTRAKMKSQVEIREMSKHQIFKDTMTAKALSTYKNEDIVMKMWFMLNESEPDLETKHIRKEIVSIDITPEQSKQIMNVCDRILLTKNAVQKMLVANGSTEKSSITIAKKIVSKTHMLSITPFISRMIVEGLSVEATADWFIGFFGQKQTGTISALYNENSRGGNAKRVSIAKRHKELDKYYDSWHEKYMLKTKENARIMETEERTELPVNNENIEIGSANMPPVLLDNYVNNSVIA